MPYEPAQAGGPEPVRSIRHLEADARRQHGLLIEFVNSEQYTQATSAILDNYLTMSQPFQRALETTMTRTLTMLNMPTRAEVTSLAERMTNIELRLDDLDARLDEILAAIKANQGEGT
jgi:hypothetical protein